MPQLLRLVDIWCPNAVSPVTASGQFLEEAEKRCGRFDSRTICERSVFVA
jgi:hypothetical protein